MTKSSKWVYHYVVRLFNKISKSHFAYTFIRSFDKIFLLFNINQTLTTGLSGRWEETQSREEAVG